MKLILTLALFLAISASALADTKVTETYDSYGHLLKRETITIYGSPHSKKKSSSMSQAQSGPLHYVQAPPAGRRPRGRHYVYFPAHL